MRSISSRGAPGRQRESGGRVAKVMNRRQPSTPAARVRVAAKPPAAAEVGTAEIATLRGREHQPIEDRSHLSQRCDGAGRGQHARVPLRRVRTRER